MCEIFKLKIWRTSLVVIAAIVLVSSAVVFYGLKKEIKISQAGAGHNILGFAWSKNIGWISFNSSNCDTDSNGFVDTDAMVQGCGGDNSTDIAFDYGVNVDLDSVSPTFEELSGYAWSKNIGWISFDKTIAGNPPSVPYNAAETFMAKLDTGTGKFSGWARALSACQDDLWNGAKCTGVGAGNKSGGWDGWIKLRKDPADPGSDYGVSLNGADFEGWAWGGDVVGWISFNSKNCDINGNGIYEGAGEGAPAGCPIAGAVNPYKVYFSNNSPTVIPAAPSIPTNWCALSPGSIKLPWAFDDAEDGAGNQTAYQIKLTRNPGGATCTSGKKGSPAVPDTTGSLSGAEINLFATDPGCANFIDYGNYTYNWSMTVWDSVDTQSVTVGGTPFGPTPTHQYPTAKFSYDPVPPPDLVQFQNIIFDPLTAPNDSQAYGGESIISFEWDFNGDAVINDTTFPPLADPKAIHSYTVDGVFVVDLKVTDSTLPVGHSCWASDFMTVPERTITIGKSMPEWNETMP